MLIETDFRLVGLMREADSMPGAPVEAEVPESQNFSAELESLEGRAIRGDQGHLMRGERIASQSEVIRAIVSGHSPCCGAPHQNDCGPSSSTLPPWAIVSRSMWLTCATSSVSAYSCGSFLHRDCSCRPWLQLR